MSSFTHETIINECKLKDKKLDESKTKQKLKLSMMLLENKLRELQDKKTTIEHTLYYSRRPITDEEENFLETDLENINDDIEDTAAEMNDLYNQECDFDNLKENIKNTISTTKLAALPSFQSRNQPTTKKVLSDPYMFKNIISYNTGLGGKSRKYKSKSKSKSKPKSKKSRKMRKTRRIRKRTSIIG